MATRSMRRAAVLLLALGFSAGISVGCGGAHSHRRLADKSAADKSGRVRIAREAESKKAPARLRGDIALASNAPRPVEPAVITDANFSELVLNSSVPVMVDCTAGYCAPCKKMLPIVHELAGEYDGRAVVAKLDIEACPDIAARYGVNRIPAFLIFQNGEVVDSVVGMVPKATLGGKLEAVAGRVQTVSRESAALTR
jgi:thioredoxin 1